MDVFQRKFYDFFVQANFRNSFPKTTKIVVISLKLRFRLFNRVGLRI